MLTEVAREQMIHQQVRAWEVLDQRVLQVFERVPRERFVPPAFRQLAFADTAIPLGAGEHMLAPKVVGRILQAIEVAPGDRALEVGTGSGFLTACLAMQCASVRSLERLAGLATTARENIAALGLPSATVETIDAFVPGALGSVQFNVIVLTGSLPLPDPRFEQQLTIGGRLFVIVGTPPVMHARLVRRVSEREFVVENLFETSIAPLVGAPHPETFVF